MELFWILVSMLVLLLLKGFFSGSEIALVNADKIKLNARANQGHRGAKLVLRLFQRPEVLLGTTLVGTNISTVILTTIGTLLMIRHFGERGDLLAFLVFTPLFLIFGEIVPKSVYQQKSDDIAPVVVYPLRAFSAAVLPDRVHLLARRSARRPHGGRAPGGPHAVHDPGAHSLRSRHGRAHVDGERLRSQPHPQGHPLCGGPRWERR